MKKQTNKRWQSFLLATIVAILMHGVTVSVSAQDDKYPKPDFSAMEKYYEVTKYEYDFNANVPVFYVVVKRKAENVPKWWIIKWFDGDGVALSTGSFLFDPGYKASVDDPMRSKAYAPWKREMPKVKRIVVYEDTSK